MRQTNKVYWFLAFVLILNGLDVITTLLGLKYGGTEINPLLGDPSSFLSIGLKIFFLLILTCTSSYSLHYGTKHKIDYLQVIPAICLLVLAIFFTIVIANNIIAISQLLALNG